MDRSIVRQFQNGTLTPASELIDVKYIGSYLYARLKHVFSPRTQILTISSYANRIRNMSEDTIKKRLQVALQNDRNNMCVRTSRRPQSRSKYHVADYNQKGYEAMISLTRVLARGQDGYNIGHNMLANPAQLRLPPTRDNASKETSCLSRSRCRNRGRWYDNLCQPPSNTRGFPGVYPRSGQKTRQNRNRNFALGSMHNSIHRGRYARTPDGQYRFRRPGPMTKLR